MYYDPNQAAAPAAQPMDTTAIVDEKPMEVNVEDNIKPLPGKKKGAVKKKDKGQKGTPRPDAEKTEVKQE